MLELIPEFIRENPVLWGTIVAIIGLPATVYLGFRSLIQDLVRAYRWASRFVTLPGTRPEAAIDLRLSETVGTSSPDHIVLENTGDADAKNVTIEVHAQGKENPVLSRDRNRKFPCAIEARDYQEVDAALDKDTPPAFDVTIRWEDPGGKKEVTKTLHR